MRLILTIALLALTVMCSPALAADRLFADSFEAPSSCAATITTPIGPRTRVTVADVSYGVYQAQRRGIDLREWDNFWGYNNTTSPRVGWPGVGGASPVIRVFPRAGYLALHFRTPDLPAAASMTGGFSNPSFVAGPNVIMAISTHCGDFERHLPTPGCVVHRESAGADPWSGVPTSDANLAKWKFTPNAPGSQCNLQPATDYYVNVTLANDATDCPIPRTSCVVGVVSYHN
jgi:hypothetical protein